jgi:NAD(P)H-hydrate epimerase
MNPFSGNELPADTILITQDRVGSIYQPRTAAGHKGTYGTAVLIGGQKGSVGALLLAARAAGRAGAGRVLGILPEWGYTAFQSAVPEAQCQTSGLNHILAIRKLPEGAAVGIGPGLGQQPQTAEALYSFLLEHQQPLVVDADALNILATYPDWLALVPENSLLTPHPKEFERLFGETVNRLAAVEIARAAAKRYNVILILKGHQTAVCTPSGTVYGYTEGTPALATAGSGDVLTGILTGLLAQGYPPEAAAQLGVWLHGYAGRYCADRIGDEATVATDLARYAGIGFRKLKPDGVDRFGNIV